MAETSNRTVKCNKCGRMLAPEQFYTYKDGTKTELCKKCLTMHLNPFEEDTYLWLLEKMDLPYIPNEWNLIRDKDYMRDPKKASGTAIFGKYVAKMKLKQYSQYDYAHSAEAQLEFQGKTEEREETNLHRNQIEASYAAEMKAKLDNGEITEAQYKTLVNPYGLPDDMDLYEEAAARDKSFFNENDYMSESDLPDPAESLTDEDKIYLAMKWGRLYKPSEWIELERKYKEMTESFDIQDSDTTGTLILICKTYLKMNQAVGHVRRGCRINLVNLIRGVKLGFANGEI